MIVNFTVFVDKVEDGRKTQTIRKLRKGKRQIKVGDMLQLYYRQRFPDRKLIRETPCTGIDRIVIATLSRRVSVNDKNLKYGEIIELAHLDGFDSEESFFHFFRKQYVLLFDGVIVKWDKPKKTDECTYCRGTGLVQVAPNARGVKTCPYCKKGR